MNKNHHEFATFKGTRLNLNTTGIQSRTLQYLINFQALFLILSISSLVQQVFCNFKRHFITGKLFLQITSEPISVLSKRKRKKKYSFIDITDS